MDGEDPLAFAKGCRNVCLIYFVVVGLLVAGWCLWGGRSATLGG
ncbi:MAG TPA: hypothetical protein VEI97_08255 [bacterium]|nr:hypothetical protein [bacterium]